jgi:hypothetical protein
VDVASAELHLFDAGTGDAAVQNRAGDRQFLGLRSPVRQSRLTPVDAQMYWMSAKIPNDQFLLYGFAGLPADIERAIAEVRECARSCRELTLRIDDGDALTYPAWVPGDVDPGQFVVHELADDTWRGCLDAVTQLADDQLDPRDMAWRLHVFGSVHRIPGSAIPGTVAVLQVPHALADGTRASALAALLFGRPGSVPAVPPRSAWPVSAALPWRGIQAARTHRQLVRDTRAGAVPPPGETRPALRTNARPAGVRGVRTLVRHRSQLPGPTVTIGVLGAVSTALSAHLRELGDEPAQIGSLGAEVPMAGAGVRLAHSHFGNVAVGLYPELEPDERARRIADDLAGRRLRAGHPAMRAESQAFAAVPAPLLRRGIAQFDPDVRSPTVTGNTVVSSVNRGPADLRFGGVPVTVTAGYPALSPMMGLTHGVHGIGDTVAVSVHAAESALGDIDAYLERLDSALRQ